MPLRSVERSVLVLSLTVSIAGCDRVRSHQGESLARTYCAACHEFPDPSLLDKKTWQSGVLPRMKARVGVQAKSLYDETSQSPYMVTLSSRISEKDWNKIVAYYREQAPNELPSQSLPSEPTLDPPFFPAVPFSPGLKSSGIITLLKVDSVRERIYVGDAGLSTLQIFDFNRRIRSTIRLSSPAIDLIIHKDHLLVLEVGILDPNDQARGSLVRYDFASTDSLRVAGVVLESLLRPVFVRELPSDAADRREFIVCEYGNNQGRLALYRPVGNDYQREVLDGSPGAIRFELRDMNGDGAPDLVALFAQGDERIVLFENDGHGGFSEKERTLARFPPVYGSMHFSLEDFNGDGAPDIVYVNGDNFDYSSILKPYHGVRILENDGQNNFREKFFFPIYGAARTEVDDFDGDGRLDILVTSDFSDFKQHPERGIIFLKGLGDYKFRPFAFRAAAANQWNLTAVAHLNKNAFPDIIVGAMDIGNIARIQRRGYAQPAAIPLLLLENRVPEHSRVAPR